MSNRIITIRQILDRNNRGRIKMSIINHSRTMRKMITSHSVETTIMINTINPNEIIRKRDIKKKHINRNLSKDSHNRIIGNSKNNQIPLSKEVSRRSIVKIECKSKSMLPINWYLAGNAKENSTQTVYKNINPSARKSSSRREKSSMHKINVSLPKNRKNSWNTEK